MAKNYSLAEAVQVLLENEDTAAIADIGRRYPLLAVKITRVAVKAGEEFGDLMQFMPENLSANKINGTIKKALEDAGEEEYDEEDAALYARISEQGSQDRLHERTSGRVP